VEETHGQGAGWLGTVYDPMRIDADGSLPDYHVGDFDLPDGVSSDRLQTPSSVAGITWQARRSVRQRSSDDAGTLQPAAFELLATPDVTKAFDLTSEPAAVRERYGMNVHGQSVLQATTGRGRGSGGDCLLAQ
jgi:hypothetical protein